MTGRHIPKDDPRRAQWGQRLKDARIERGLTQDAAAEILGVSRTYLSNLESGYRIESWPTWLDMVTTLGYRLQTVAPELVSPDSHGSTENFATNPNTSETPQLVDSLEAERGSQKSKREKI